MDSALRLANTEASREPDAVLDETGLADALCRGSREAAEALVAQTYELVYASLYRLCGGDGELAADLTQETYRKAWASLSGFERRARFSTWLYRIAYNTFLNHVRRKDRTTPLEDLEPELPALETDAETLLSEREISARLRRAVLGLPDELRFTVTARFWGELPIQEIARTEGVSTVAIRKRLRKAFEAVRASWDEESTS